MRKSLFRNLRLQSYLQLLNTLIPLITTPYVARVLGPDNSGKYSFNHSVSAFFTLFALLGTVSYGTRSIAGARSAEEKYTTFWSIYSLQAISVLISMFVYVLYCMFFNQSGVVAYCFLLSFIGCLFNIQWYYYGTEDFQSTTISHMICRIGMVVSLFLFVKKPSDLIIYTVILAGFESLAYIFLWVGIFCRKKIPFHRVTFQDVKTHIKPNLILFVPLLAMSIYHIMDKTMIGIFSSDVQGGYYYNIEKIINVPLGLFTGFSTVLLPRMTVLYTEDKDNAISFFNNSLSILMMFGFAVSFGIISISEEFVPLFLGEEYISCIVLIKIFAPVLIIKCISNAIRAQLLIPAKMEKIYITATILGTVVNLLINTILIPKHGALGAIIGTIFAEVTALLYQLFYTRKEVRIKKIIIECMIFLGFSIVMVFVVRLVSTVDINSFAIITNSNLQLMLKVFFEVLAGGGVYILLSFAYSWIVRNYIYDYFHQFRTKTKPR